MKKGYKLTEEHRRKLSEARLRFYKNGGKPAMLGKRHSVEAREKVRQAQLAHNSMAGKIPWNKGREMPEETRQKVRVARAKQVITKEQARKTGESLKRLWDSGILKKEQWCTWKGEKVGYPGLHKRIRKELGTPDTCEHCGKSGLTGRQIHWANKSGDYRTDLDDWIRLCVKCHINYDKGRSSIVARFGTRSSSAVPTTAQ